MCRGARLSRAGASRTWVVPHSRHWLLQHLDRRQESGQLCSEDTNTTANSFICNLRVTQGSRDKRDSLM